MSPRDDQRATDHIETASEPSAFAHWPAEVYEEMLENAHNGCVGTVLVSETDTMRVWHLHIAPGARCGFHRHVNPYFWSAFTPGKARTYFSDGRVEEMEYFKGETRHFHYEPGESMLHSLENIGETELVFVTVEHLETPGVALPVPDHVRLVPPS
jgi:oxalate decarboxylase/phosphoglucose isomerase-like protein (cupin superfamily)